MTGPTSQAEINALLTELLSRVQAIVGQHWVGLYLTGSLAEGDFDPHTSDIDFVIVTDEVLPDESVLALKAMHARLRASGQTWATRVEGDYIPHAALRRFDPAQSRYPHLGVDGRFEVEQHGGESILQRHSLRERGVVVAGPDPKTLIDPLGPDDLRAAIFNLLHAWWAPMLDRNPVFLHSAEYQAYAVLTMCRMWYTLEHGAVVSKRAAAGWAQAALDKRWEPLIDWALTWRPNLQTGDGDNLPQVLDFIRYTLEWS